MQLDFRWLARRGTRQITPRSVSFCRKFGDELRQLFVQIGLKWLGERLVAVWRRWSDWHSDGTRVKALNNRRSGTCDNLSG